MPFGAPGSPISQPAISPRGNSIRNSEIVSLVIPTPWSPERCIAWMVPAS